MEPIDAVISWVDGDDPKYQEKLRQFCAATNIDHKTAIEPTRFQQVNEIYYCLACLNKNTPWLRNIYIITNEQTPPAVDKLKDTYFGRKIKIIDQNDLLKQFNIDNPIFNSLSVEWLIWSIPELAAKFIYLNDDFFITRPLQPEDFFMADKIKIRGQWKVQARAKFEYKIHKFFTDLCNLPAPKIKIDVHRSWQEDSARRAGFHKKFYFLEHSPFALKKSFFENYIQSNQDIFQKNASRPFRDPDHISSVPLLTHLEIVKNKTIDDKIQQVIMVNGATHSFNKIKERLQRANSDAKISFVCMQSIDQAPLEVQEYMIKWLQKCLK